MQCTIYLCQGCSTSSPNIRSILQSHLVQPMAPQKIWKISQQGSKWQLPNFWTWGKPYGQDNVAHAPDHNGTQPDWDDRSLGLQTILMLLAISVQGTLQTREKAGSTAVDRARRRKNKPAWKVQRKNQKAEHRIEQWTQGVREACLWHIWQEVCLPHSAVVGHCYLYLGATLLIISYLN